MRKTKTKRPAKKVVRSAVKRPRKSAPTVAAAALVEKLPFVEAPPTVIVALEEPRPQAFSPLMMWSALPLAMMRMVLGNRHSPTSR